MNYKLEKFWNSDIEAEIYVRDGWTINLKSFEIKEFQEVNEMLSDEL